MQASHIFVHPSLSESLGISIVEAMACGLPIVAAKTGGVISLIEEGVSGLFVEPGDVDDLRRMIQILIDNEVFRKQLGNAAYQTYLQGAFTPKVVGDEIEHLYLNVLGVGC